MLCRRIRVALKMLCFSSLEEVVFVFFFAKWVFVQLCGMTFSLTAAASSSQKLGGLGELRSHSVVSAPSPAPARTWVSAISTARVSEGKEPMKEGGLKCLGESVSSLVLPFIVSEIDVRHIHISIKKQFLNLL